MPFSQILNRSWIIAALLVLHVLTAQANAESQQNAWGYVDSKNVIIIKPQFRSAFPFKNGAALVDEGTDTFFIDPSGKNISGMITRGRVARFESLDFQPNVRGLDFVISTEGLVPFQVKHSFGFINTKGKITIAPIYDHVREFADGLAAVRKGTKWGYINPNGKTVIPIKYDEAGSFSEGLATTKSKNSIQIIDQKGKIQFKTTGLKSVGEFKNGFAVVCLPDGKFGFIDKSGKVGFERFDAAHSYSEGLAAVLSVGMWIFIDTNGRVIGKCYHQVRDFHEGLASVTYAAKSGYINRAGEEVIPLTLDGGLDFSDGLAGARKGEKWGLIDKKGNFAVPPVYGFIGLYKNGLAPVRL